VLSNPFDGKQADDVAEAAAEAFGRELLYLSAVYGTFGRTYQAMINPAIDQEKARGPLDSRAFVEKEVATQYHDAQLLCDVKRLRVVCMALASGSATVSTRESSPSTLILDAATAAPKT
jgi:hypothetical protein